MRTAQTTAALTRLMRIAQTTAALTRLMRTAETTAALTRLMRTAETTAALTRLMRTAQTTAALTRLMRIAQTTAALTKLKPVWNVRHISLSSKIRLMRSLVTFIFLYACESWTLTEELQRRIQALETRCYRKILRISYKYHVSNEEVRTKIQQAIGPHEDLTTVKKRRLQWYGDVSHFSDLAKAIYQGTMKGGRQTEEEEGRQHQEMYRLGVLQVPEGSGELGNIEETGCEIICGVPTTLVVKG